ncbi:hypothetical protein HMPREF9120_00213 [Neisseria sp. oral taxon 020 str. F0370]|nr:hypothetical protein HMPREF9120_00213 [Neisseria sp. oral taxon 020 str. F0370]
MGAAAAGLPDIQTNTLGLGSTWKTAEFCLPAKVGLSTSF